MNIYTGEISIDSTDSTEVGLPLESLMALLLEVPLDLRSEEPLDLVDGLAAVAADTIVLQDYFRLEDSPQQILR